MNLDTTYLNLPLRSPLVVSASPLSRSLDNIKRMEGAGAGAVVLYSLFEEEIRLEQQILRYYEEHPSATTADALARFPAQEQFSNRLDDYLKHITSAKQAVAIPIIASLNCRSLGTWTDVAKQIELAGADALELNIYPMVTNMEQSSEHVESMVAHIAEVVKAAISIPLAVKLSPYFTNLSRMARQLDGAGMKGLVFFNRFYQPDLDPKTLKLKDDLPLANPSDVRLPLHWIAILHRRIKADLAATGGIYTAEDVVKLLMVGAKVTMVNSALLKDGIDRLASMTEELRAWLEENDYTSIASLQGILPQFHSKDAASFERTQYVRAITPPEAEGL